MRGLLLRVRRERLERGLTLEEVADQAGVSKSTLRQVETGKFVPYLRIRKHLAQYYKVKESELFKDIDSAQRFLAKVAGR